MEILGIGINELVFIFIIALIVLGPRDMQKAGRTIGRWLRRLVTSDGWKVFQQTSRELRTLPNRLMREANEELEQINNEVRGVTGTQPRRLENPPPSRSQAVPENNIAPPRAEPKSGEDDRESNA